MSTAQIIVFSHDVTAAILVSQNNETAAMLVSQTNPLGARSIQPKFLEISVQNSMDRFGPTGKVSKKRVLRWTTFPGRTGWNFG